jgi:hypothetical protein
MTCKEILDYMQNEALEDQLICNFFKDAVSK